jgi:hypothetical protein
MQGKRKTPASNAVVGGLHLSRSSTTASPQRPHRRPHATDEHLLLALVGSDLVESFLCWRSSSSTRSSEVLAERSLRWREAPPPHARQRRACGAVPALVGGALAESSRPSWCAPNLVVVIDGGLPTSSSAAAATSSRTSPELCSSAFAGMLFRAIYLCERESEIVRRGRLVR